jgi:hypothetical protein
MTLARGQREGRRRMKESVDDLRKCIERLHHCEARLSHVSEVSESFQGMPAWQGVVCVFDLTGHPTATRAYAWSSPIEGSTKRRFYAVLHVPPVASAADAVRAAIVQDYREKVGSTPGQPFEPVPSNRRSKRSVTKRRIKGEANGDVG